MTVLILFLILLTFLSGYFSGTETALFSLPATKIKTYASSKDPRKRMIASYVQKPRDLLVTVFMLNTLVNILLQNVSSSMFGEGAGWDLKVGVPLALTLVLGEIIPKNIGMQHNEKISYYVMPSIAFFQELIKPIRKLTIAVTAPVSRFMFFYLKKEEDISKDELKHVLRTSEAHGVLHPDEAELVWGYLNLQDATVKELMRPKEDILYHNIHDPLTKLVHLFVDRECTRVPVCDQNVDNILGVISAKQFFLHRQELKSATELRHFLKKPLYVPETTSARKLLKRFDETQHIIAIVVDEYGSVVGLISREDLAEVVIGKIVDRRDQKALYTRAGENEVIASGKLELATFNQLFDVELKSEHNMVTIGGWLVEQLGDLPKVGTKYKTDQFLFQVLAAYPNRIRRLYIRKFVPNSTGQSETMGWRSS